MNGTKRPLFAIVASAILITAFLRASAPQTSSAQAWSIAPTTQGSLPHIPRNRPDHR